MTRETKRPTLKGWKIQADFLVRDLNHKHVCRHDDDEEEDDEDGDEDEEEKDEDGD